MATEGELLKQAITLSTYKIDEVVEITGISRGQLYNLFKEDKIKDEYKIRLDKLKLDLDFSSKRTINTKAVPYYDIDAHAGNVSIFQEDGNEYVKQWIEVPAFSDCEMFIGVSGNSMYPKYCSGELIALKKINDMDNISWKEAHLVVTKEQRLLKYILPGKTKEHWTLTSENKQHPPMQDFPKKKVLYLYIVKGKITKNII